MKGIAVGLAGIVLGLFTAPSGAWAQVTRVVVTREASEPETVQINVGQEVEWVNASGETAHVWFGRAHVLGFYIGPGGVRVKFGRTGSYDYAVHLSGSRFHTHPGRVVVK